MNTQISNYQPIQVNPLYSIDFNHLHTPYYIDYNKPILLSTDASIRTIKGNKVYSAAHVMRYNTSFGVIVNRETIYPDRHLLQDTKVTIQDLETFAIIAGLNSISRIGFFQQVYIISDNEQALKNVTNFLQQRNCQFNISLFWVKSHHYLVNDIADDAAGSPNTRTFANANFDELLPNGTPFSQFSNLGYIGGLGRAYPSFQRPHVFSNLTQV